MMTTAAVNELHITCFLAHTVFKYIYYIGIVGIYLEKRSSHYNEKAMPRLIRQQVLSEKLYRKTVNSIWTASK